MKKSLFFLALGLVAVWFGMSASEAQYKIDPTQLNHPYLGSPLEKFKTQRELMSSKKELIKKAIGLRGKVWKYSALDLNLDVIEKSSRKLGSFEAQNKLLFDKKVTNFTLSSQLGFLNSVSEYSDVIQLDYGVCLGVTALNWMANYLMLFDEEGLFLKAYQDDVFDLDWFKANIHGKADGTEYTEMELTAIAEFYKPLLDQVTVFRQPTVIPFFKNIEEFSSHPALLRHFKYRALELWYDFNVSIASYRKIYPSTNPKKTKLTEAEVLKLQTDIKRYLDQALSPILFLSWKGDGEIHVMRVQKQTLSEDGKFLVIHLLDPNQFDSSTEVWLSFKKDDKGDIVSKTKWGGGLLAIDLVPWMNQLSMETLQNWARFQNKNTELVKTLLPLQ